MRVLCPMAVAGALLGGCSSPGTGGSDGELASVDGGVLRGVDAVATDVGSVRVAVGGVALRGSEEVPGPGVAGGSGSAQVVVMEHRGEVCVEITVRDLDQPSAAHLHEGAPGQAGDVILALPAPSHGNGSVDACVSAASDVIERLQADIAGFYVNIHTVAAPDGAIRGQLG